MSDLKTSEDPAPGEDKPKTLLSNLRHERLSSARSAESFRWESIAAAMVVCGVAALAFAWILFNTADLEMPLAIGAIAISTGAGFGAWLGLMMPASGTAAKLLSTVWRSFTGNGEFGLVLFPTLILILIAGP